MTNMGFLYATDKDGNVWTFGRWLLIQVSRHDPIGDLARDIAEGCPCIACADPDRDPNYWTIADVVRDLDDHSACDAAYEALERAAAEWTWNP